MGENVQQVMIHALIERYSPLEVFRTVADFAQYPALVDTVKAVDVHPGESSAELRTDWEVYFRNGILRWSEHDVLDEEALTITFEQDDGDFDVFRGSWDIEEGEASTGMRFTAAFDFGVPSLASIIDPVAVRVLTETMETIVDGLFDAPVTFQHGSSLDRGSALSDARR